MKHQFVEANRHRYGVKLLCEVLQVSRSGYYAARCRPPSQRRQRQAALTARIGAIHAASRETYGAPRVHTELRAQGVGCCRNTVAKLAGRVLQGHRRLGHGQDARHTVGDRRLGHGDTAARRRSCDPALRSGLHLQRSQLSADPGSARNPAKHVQERRLLGQCPDGELLPHAEDRARDGFYNRQRRHSTINYEAPLEFEAARAAS